MSNCNIGNKGHITPTRKIYNLGVPRVHRMVWNDINMPIFNGNGLEDPQQHWFLCEVVWIMRQVQDESLNKA